MVLVVKNPPANAGDIRDKGPFPELGRKTGSLCPNWIISDVLIGKAPEAGKDWGQEDKGTTEDGITDSMDMSLSKLQGNSEGQGSLLRCSPRGHKEPDTTKRRNNHHLDLSDRWVSKTM